MCLDPNWQTPDPPAFEAVGLATLGRIREDGLEYTPHHAFTAATGVPGVVFAIRRESDGADIGTAMVLLSNDRDAVMHVGHIGCDIRPEHRKQGHTIRLIRALAPFLHERGVEDIVLACDVGHQSQYDSCLLSGAIFLGDTFGAEGGACGGARFILPAQAESNPQ